MTLPGSGDSIGHSYTERSYYPDDMTDNSNIPPTVCHYSDVDDNLSTSGVLGVEITGRCFISVSLT